VWDLRAGKTLAQGWQLLLTVDNVLDNEYATAKRYDNVDYVAAGRTVMASVRYDFSL
jgi:vitamin B12 transporter